MTDTKPYLIYGTPRSGSTLLYNLISGYLQQVRGDKPLGEIFNLADHFKKTEDGIFAIPADGTLNYLASSPLGQNEITKRFSWLKEDYGRNLYTIKILDFLQREQYVPWFLDHYCWVLIERRNLFEQTLSYLISMVTNVWWSAKGDPRAPMPAYSLEARTNYIVNFEKLYLNYLKTKQTVNPKKIIYYEDMYPNFDPASILKHLGLTEPINYSKLHFNEKQNPDSKLELFKNPDQIISAYKNSALNDIFPI